MGQAFGTAVMFNETMVAQARVIAPTMKFHLYAHCTVREKIARDMLPADTAPGNVVSLAPIEARDTLFTNTSPVYPSKLAASG